MRRRNKNTTTTTTAYYLLLPTIAKVEFAGAERVPAFDWLGGSALFNTRSLVVVRMFFGLEESSLAEGAKTPLEEMSLTFTLPPATGARCGAERSTCAPRKVMKKRCNRSTDYAYSSRQAPNGAPLEQPSTTLKNSWAPLHVKTMVDARAPDVTTTSEKISTFPSSAICVEKNTFACPSKTTPSRTDAVAMKVRASPSFSREHEHALTFLSSDCILDGDLVPCAELMVYDRGRARDYVK